MVAVLGSCLLLAVALLGPGPSAQAMKGRSPWGQAGMGRTERRCGQAAVRVSGGFYVGIQKAGGPFMGVG